MPCTFTLIISLTAQQELTPNPTKSLHAPDMHTTYSSCTDHRKRQLDYDAVNLQLLDILWISIKTRMLSRWERASKLGLDPPQGVLQALEQLDASHPEQQGIWADRT